MNRLKAMHYECCVWGKVAEMISSIRTDWYLRKVVLTLKVLSLKQVHFGQDEISEWEDGNKNLTKSCHLFSNGCSPYAPFMSALSNIIIQVIHWYPAYLLLRNIFPGLVKYCPIHACHWYCKQTSGDKLYTKPGG